MQYKVLDNFFYITILLFPTSYILGNFALNLTIALSILFSLILIIKNKSFFLFKENFLILSFIFCLLLIISSLINIENSDFKKSLLYLRYPFFSLSIIFFHFYFSHRKINFFYKLNFIFIIFIILDFIYQIFNGKNLLGFKPRCLLDDQNNLTCDRFAGLFDQEFIMGAYLLIVAITIINIFLIINKKTKYLLLINLVIGFLILKTGEKTNFLGFVIFIIFYLYYFLKNFNRKNNILIFFLFVFSFFIAVKFDDSINKRYIQFVKNDLKTDESKNLIYKIKASPWLIHYRGALEIFNKNNILIGSGIKSFRKVCKDYDYVLSDRELREQNLRVCSTHPHNMYLEVLVESGLIGFVIFLALAIIILMKLIRSKKFLNYFLFCLIISIIFPFKPTGSIFSTITASLYWFILSLPIAFEKYEMKKINND